MPTPTTEIFAILLSVMMRLKPIVSRRSSSNAWARGSSVCGTVKVTSVSPLSRPTFWMIMSTLMLARASGSNISATEPGRSGTRVRMIFASFLSCAIPVTSFRSTSPVSTNAFISSSDTMSVPGRTSAGTASSPTKLERTCTRTPARMASPTDRVWRTLAPTLASSSISSYVTAFSLRALATMRGSVV